MTEIPRKWSLLEDIDYPPLPSDLIGGKLWVTIDGRERHAVCAVDEDEGWIEQMVFDRKDGKAIHVLHKEDAVTVRLHGHVEQGLTSEGPPPEQVYKRHA
jgi:hypothetical protein